MNDITLDKELKYAHLGLDLHSVDFDKLRNPFINYKGREDYEQIILPFDIFSILSPVYFSWLFSGNYGLDHIHC